LEKERERKEEEERRRQDELAKERKRIQLEKEKEKEEEEKKKKENTADKERILALEKQLAEEKAKYEKNNKKKETEDVDSPLSYAILTPDPSKSTSANANPLADMLADPAVSQLLSNPQLLAALPKLIATMSSLQSSINPNTSIPPNLYANPAAPQKNEMMKQLEDDERKRNEEKSKKEKEEDDEKLKKKEARKKKMQDEKKRVQMEKEEKEARAAAKAATTYVDSYMKLWHMGFKPHDAIIQALHRARGDVEEAVEYLTHI